MVLFVILNYLAHLLNMTEHDIQERLKSLEAQRIQMEANLNAIGGAIQDCHFWLDKITSSPKNVVKIKGNKGE